jgi:hypothetical protein
VDRAAPLGQEFRGQTESWHFHGTPVYETRFPKVSAPSVHETSADEHDVPCSVVCALGRVGRGGHDRYNSPLNALSRIAGGIAYRSAAVSPWRAFIASTLT